MYFLEDKIFQSYVLLWNWRQDMNIKDPVTEIMQHIFQPNISRKINKDI